MLQGTLDVFSLDEVLGLLSGANKNGVLNITGDRGVGSVSISDGHLVAGSASSAPGAAELSDVVFELLRYEEGSFSFDGAAEAEGEPHALESVMAEAHSRLDEWKGIEAVVPSLDHHVSLSATLATSQVTLSESEWAAVVAIGEGASAGVVARRLGVGEFDGSKRIKALIERSLASLDDVAPIASTETAAPAAEVEVEVEETPAFAAPVFETPAPAPASFADVAAPIENEVSDLSLDTGSSIETDLSIDTVAPDAPAFEDAAPAFEDSPLDGFAADAEIPPMPEAPSFASFEAADTLETEVPPMPEPPSFGNDAFDVPPAPVADTAPSTFGGLDALDGPDMFEAPRRAEDRSADVFGSDGFDAGDLPVGSEMDTPMPPPPAPTSAADDAVPSFAPPSGFDAGAFGGTEEFSADSDDATEAVAEDAPEEKGGSLLMRYLKSNG